MNRFISALICFFMIILLPGCSSVQLNETSSGVYNSINEEIRLNNCGGKADAEQTVERAQSVAIEQSADIGINGDLRVVQGYVDAHYSSLKTKSLTKTQKVIAPPGTNMRFVLEWKEEIAQGTISTFLQFKPSNYRISLPIGVSLVSSEDIGCSGIPSSTPANIATPKPTQTTLTQKLSQQRAWPIVLEEKFTNASRGWTTGIDNGNLAQENLAIAGGKYTWIFTTKKSMASFSFPTMPEQIDMYISVDMQMISTTGNMEDQGGITFRQSQADQSFYFFSVNSNGSYSLTMYDGSGWDTLIPTSDTNLLKANQVNHLGVSIQGITILLEINGSVFDSFEDSRLSAGVAGLGLHLPAPKEDATVIFSNFTVRAPKK